MSYLLSWAFARGYYEVLPESGLRWFTEEEIEWHERLRRDWLQNLKTLPRSEEGWKKIFGLPSGIKGRKIDKEEIRARVDFRALIEETASLRVKGGRGTALCPFHGERRPSFSVDFEKGVWFCHAEGMGGDIFDFLMRRDGVTFPEAVEILSQKL